MTLPTTRRMVYMLAGLLAVIFAVPGRVASQPKDNIYHQHNLISDLPGSGEHRDPNLVNPWGIAYGPGGPFWIADNHTGVSTVYDGAGKGFPAGNPLVVTVPPPTGGMSPSAPTGIVFNGTGQFIVTKGPSSGPGVFIFATEDGTISGWNPSVDATNAILEVDNSGNGSVYKGLALGSNSSGNFLYATNFNHGTIDVFNSSFAAASLSGNFQDPNLPAGFAPFGIRNIGGNLYVTYAKQDSDKHDDVAGPGNGFVDIFNTDGVLQKRLIFGGVLNSPWGLEMAPSNFGALSNTLLVGNFGDGTIHGFNPSNGTLVDQALIPSGRPLAIHGLWGLMFGNGGLGGDPGVLYFTAGIPGSGTVEDHGQFGEISPQHP